MSHDNLDIDFSYRNLGFDPSVFYQGSKILIREKRKCLFCSSKATNIICNDQKDGLLPFVGIRHCNSKTCRDLAIDSCRESLMSLIKPDETDSVSHFFENDPSLNLA